MRKGEAVVNWTVKEEAKLADAVLDTVAGGGTQLEGFKRASELLETRTKEACAFRWHTAVRQHYVEPLKIARMQGLQVKENKRVIEPVLFPFENDDPIAPKETTTFQDPITEAIVNAVLQFVPVRAMAKELYAEKNKLAETNERLLIENEAMRRRIEELEQIEQDFAALVGIMERSRKMAFVPDEKPVFKMVDGALERVNN